MKTIIVFILSVALELVSVHPSWAQVGKTPDLQDLIDEALQNNPQLRAVRHSAAASRTRIDQSTSWDAPQIGVELYQVPVASFPNPFRNNMETDYFIQQMIPFPGKLSAMGEAAENNAGMAEQSARALERKIIRDLKTAYYELYFVQHKIQLNNENRELMRRFLTIAQSQYEVGMGKQPDILRAQTELSILLNDGITMEKEKTVVEAMINTIINRPIASPLGDVPEIKTNIPQWTLDQLRPLVIENRPELKGMDLNIAMNRAELTASKREYLPDFMVRTMYKDMAMTRDDFWSVMIAVSIPLSPWSSGKYTARVEENELNVNKAEAEYQNMRNMAFFGVQDALMKVQTNRNQVELYTKTIIPQAEQTLQSTLAAYQTGKTEFLMLIDAYRMLLMAKNDHAMAVMNYMSSQADLEQAVGLDVKHIAEKIQ
jgi:cobalt-zinc-cadmium efflux system outer membrane protein